MQILFYSLLLVVVTLSVSAEEAAFQVTHFRLGPGAVESGSEADVFIGRLTAYDEYEVGAHKRWYGARWDGLPEDVPPEQWICLADVAFGKRLNLLALQRDAKGDITMCAWRQALSSLSSPKYSYIHSIPPGPDATQSLAMIEMAAAVKLHLDDPGRPAGPRVRVQIKPWSNAEDELGGGNLFNLEGGGGDRASAASGEQIEAIRLLVIGALWQAGYQPTLADDAPATLSLEVAREVESFSVRAKWQHGDVSHELQKRKLAELNLFPALVATIQWLTRWQDSVSDIVQLSQESLEPIAFVEDHLIHAPKGHAPAYLLESVQASSLLTRWRLPRPDRGTITAAAFKQVDGARIVYHTSPALVPMNLTDGGLRVGRWGLPTHDWGFAPIGEEGMAVIHEKNLNVHLGREKWTFAAKDWLDAGPLVHQAKVFAGGRDGLVHAFDLADGKPLWSTHVGGPAYGQLVATEDGLLVATQNGILTRLQASDGAALWQRQLGDALVGTPWVRDSEAVIAWGSGNLAVIDLASGETVQAAEHPVLLHAVVPAPVPERAALAAIDIAGTVSFYGADDLALRGQVALEIRPQSIPLFHADVPVTWGVGEGLIDREPLLIVPGSRGNTYLLTIP